MNTFIKKIPIWALTLIVAVLGGVSSVFSMQMYAAYFQALGLTSVSTLIAVVVAGVMYAFFLRLFGRIVYGIGDRVFFRTMSSVPDYNLRRLPIPYNDYLRWVLFFASIAMVVTCLFSGLLVYVFPMGVYLWRFISRLAFVACMGLAYRCMDKYNVPAWQSGRCFLCLAIPAAVLFVLFEVLL